MCDFLAESLCWIPYEQERISTGFHDLYWFAGPLHPVPPSAQLGCCSTCHPGSAVPVTASFDLFPAETRLVSTPDLHLAVHPPGPLSLAAFFHSEGQALILRSQPKCHMPQGPNPTLVSNLQPSSSHSASLCLLSLHPLSLNLSCICLSTFLLFYAFHTTHS